MKEILKDQALTRSKTLLVPMFPFQTIAKRLFKNCSTLQGLRQSFNHHYGHIDSYETDLRLKLEEENMKTKLSCVGASILLDAAIKEQIRGQYRTIFVIESGVSLAHAVLVVLPCSGEYALMDHQKITNLLKKLTHEELPKEIKVLSYAHHQTLGRAKLTALKSLHAFRSESMLVIEDPNEFYTNRQRAFRTAMQVREMV